MSDCIICKIVQGELSSKKVYEDESCYAFQDISPQAKEHILVVPKRHMASLDAAQDEEALLGHLLSVCAKIAHEKGIAQSGYRVATNIGEHGGQSIAHLHLHILGGEQLAGKLG